MREMPVRRPGQENGHQITQREGDDGDDPSDRAAVDPGCFQRAVSQKQGDQEQWRSQERDMRELIDDDVCRDREENQDDGDDPRPRDVQGR